MDGEANGRLAVRQLLGIIGDKWTPVVLYELLHTEDQRFGELQRSIGQISKKVLTQTLRRLEASGLVSRTVQKLAPLHTSYRLTETGRRFGEPIEALCAWAKANSRLLADVTSKE